MMLGGKHELGQTIYKKGYQPFIFFAVFGPAFGDMKISRSRHRVEGVPEGIETIKYSMDEHAEYIRGFYQDDLETYLKEKGDEFYQMVTNAKECLVIRGDVENDRSLGYMRDVIGIIQCLCEQEAIAVFDLQTFRWYSTSEWSEVFFDRDEFDPHAHAVILNSEMENGEYWLHTRGMRKFGRPDISVINVMESETGEALQVINQMIWYEAYGAIMRKHIKINTREGKYIIHGTYTEDFDNDDFNNAFYQFDWRNVQKEQ